MNDSNQLYKLYETLLSDEHGVHIDAYQSMFSLAENQPADQREALLSLLYRCDAVDDRYFLPL